MSNLIAKILSTLVVILLFHITAEAQDSLATTQDTIKVIVVVTPGKQYYKKSAPIRTFTTEYNSAPTTAERPGYQDYLHPDIPKPRITSTGVSGTTTSVPLHTPSAGGENVNKRSTQGSGYQDYLHPDNPKPRTTGTSNAPISSHAPSVDGGTVNGGSSDGSGYQDYLHPDSPKPGTQPKSGGGANGANKSTPAHAPSVDGRTVNGNSSEDSGYQDYLHPDSPKPGTQPKSGGGANSTNSPVSPHTSSVSGGTINNASLSSSITTTTTTTTTTLPNGQKKISVKKNDTVYIKKTDTVYIDKTKDDKSRSMKALYAEVGGPGLAISLNYDARFTGERKGLGFRAGAGYFSDSYGNTIFSIPLQINYLLTRDENNFIELGGGTTFLNTTGNNKGKTFLFDKVTGFAGTATIGYRYQPVDHKLNFRIDFVPIFYGDGIIWAGGLSIGYNLN